VKFGSFFKLKRPSTHDDDDYDVDDDDEDYEQPVVVSQSV